MPFWRRHRDDKTPEREVDEPVDPDFVDPSWEPDPADFADPAGDTETQGAPDALSEPDPLAELVDPLLPFEAAPPAVMTISIPTPLPTPERPVPSWAEAVAVDETTAIETAPPPESPADTAAALDAGLQR